VITLREERDLSLINNYCWRCIETEPQHSIFFMYFK